MLNKKIFKSILNVKHAAIDGMEILSDGSFDMIMLRCSDIDVRLSWEYQAAA